MMPVAICIGSDVVYLVLTSDLFDQICLPLNPLCSVPRINPIDSEARLFPSRTPKRSTTRSPLGRRLANQALTDHNRTGSSLFALSALQSRSLFCPSLSAIICSLLFVSLFRLCALALVPAKLLRPDLAPIVL